MKEDTGIVSVTSGKSAIATDLVTALERGTIAPSDIQIGEIASVIKAIEVNEAGREMSDRMLEVYMYLCEQMRDKNQVSDSMRSLASEIVSTQEYFVASANQLGAAMNSVHASNQAMVRNGLGVLEAGAQFCGYEDWGDRIAAIRRNAGLSE